MASTPPFKCLRGVVKLPSAGADFIQANPAGVPIAVYFYDSIVGMKCEISYQRLDGVWVEISQPSTTPGIYEGPAFFEGPGLDDAVAEINQKGLVMWGAKTLQQWANDNLYAFFKPLMNMAPPAPTTKVTTALTFLDDVNGSLARDFVLIDTNSDGLPEFHGR